MPRHPLLGKVEWMLLGALNPLIQASVAQPVAQTGQVFEQVYVPWEGTLNPRWMRNWAIFRHHVLGIVRKGHRPWGVPTKLC